MKQRDKKQIVLERNNELNVALVQNLHGSSYYWAIASFRNNGHANSLHMGSETYIKRLWRERYKGKKPLKIVRYANPDFKVVKPWPHT